MQLKIALGEKVNLFWY